MRCIGLRIYSGESLILIGTASNLTNNLRFLYTGIVSLTGMNASIIFSTGGTLPTAPTVSDFFITQFDSSVIS
jgi:hypothetical protein